MAFKMTGFTYPGKAPAKTLYKKDIIHPEEEQNLLTDSSLSEPITKDGVNFYGGKSSGRTEQAIIDSDAKYKAEQAKMNKTKVPIKKKTVTPSKASATVTPVKPVGPVKSNIVDKDELKRAGKAGEVTRRGSDASVLGEIKGRLEERAGKTEKKTRKFLGRTWTKTKKYDEKGRKVGKYTEVADKGGKKIRHRQKGAISTEGPVKTEMKTTKALRRKASDTSTTTKPTVPTTTTTTTKPSPPKGRMKSDYRKKEYDKKGWAYDDTIEGYNRDGTKKKTVNKKTVNKKHHKPNPDDYKNKTWTKTGTGEDAWEWVDNN